MWNVSPKKILQNGGVHNCGGGILPLLLYFRKESTGARTDELKKTCLDLLYRMRNKDTP